MSARDVAKGVAMVILYPVYVFVSFAVVLFAFGLLVRLSLWITSSVFG